MRNRNLLTLAILVTVTIGASALFSSDARAQLPSIPSGHLIANATASTATAGDTVPSSWFDRAFCSTVGYILVRFTSLWTCAQGIPANPIWWGADPTGAADSTSAFNSALSASNYIQFPPGTFKFNSTITITLAASGIDAVTVACSGQDVTTLYWPASNGLYVSYNDMKNNSFHLKDCTLATGDSTGSYEGLTLSFDGGTYTGAESAISTVERVTFRGNDGYCASDVWGIAAYSSSISNVVFSKLYANGNSSHQGVGVYLSSINSSSPGVLYNDWSSIYNCLNIGYFYGPYIQGVSISADNFTTDNVGIYVPPGESPPLAQLTVVGSQFADISAGIEEGSTVTATIIQGNLFINEGTAVGVGLGGGSKLFATVVGNTFACASSSANGLVIESNTTTAVVTGNVFASCATGVILQSGSAEVNVQSNVYDLNGTNYLNYGSTACPASLSGNCIGGGSSWLLNRDLSPTNDVEPIFLNEAA
jgi:hypothetical protein